MSQIIAGTYQVIREIGAGGGGVVYLATHLRLGKAVVLKADKRSLTRKPEMLRREVDALKNLSHTYIPQVYDFFEEDGVVYTVIDYVEGESLDKPLMRGERFSQPQVIKWACQLLEALCYLHEQPPFGILHGDIKPANVMLTPQGDIRLIDFNIALALGEEGAARVGFSRGYASPEHYGIDYSGLGRTQTVNSAATVVTESPETQLGNQTSVPMRGESSRGSSSRSSGAVMLDVRSDIYSAGATLYHLLTGVRPAQDARQVRNAREFGVSASVAKIIERAMSPNPADRYPAAADMLDAFTHLRERDPRLLRHKRRMRTAMAVVAALFLVGAGLTMLGLRQTEREKNALVLAEYSEEAYRQGDVKAALQYAREALSGNGGLLDMPYTPEAQRALTQALGAYELSDRYAAHIMLHLPSEPIKVALSENGVYIAVLLQGEVRLFKTESGELIDTLPALESAQGDIRFNGSTLYYAGIDGVTVYSAEEERILWRGASATAIACSEDGSTVATIFKDDPVAIVYSGNGEELLHIDFGGLHQAAPTNDIFADPEDDLLALSEDGRWMTVSFSDGTLRLYDLRTGNMREIYAHSAYTHFEGGFCGDYFAYTATGQGESVFRVMETASGAETCCLVTTSLMHLSADSEGVYLASEGVVVKVDPVSGQQTEAGFITEDIAAFCTDDGALTVSAASGTSTMFDRYAQRIGEVAGDVLLDRLAMANGVAVLGSRSAPYLRIAKLEPGGAAAYTYDRDYAHDEARVSSDGKTVMLFRYDGFSLYDHEGQLLRDVQLPDPENVYDQQYERMESGCVLTVTWYDGTVRTYAASDGNCVSETIMLRPDTSLEEEFLTDTFRIVSPLHGTPQVYDRATGELLYTLESEDYLTYVTQVGEYLITEYMTAQGERYGLLLNGSGDVLADMPDLCDILPNGTLLFDDQQGNLRMNRIYSIQELLEMAAEKGGANE